MRGFAFWCVTDCAHSHILLTIFVVSAFSKSQNNVSATKLLGFIFLCKTLCNLWFATAPSPETTVQFRLVFLGFCVASYGNSPGSRAGQKIQKLVSLFTPGARICNSVWGGLVTDKTGVTAVVYALKGRKPPPLRHSRRVRQKSLQTDGS